MSRTIRSTKTGEGRFYCGRARGISKAKRKVARRCRAIQKRVLMSSEDPLIEQPKRYYDFWWNWL